MTTWALTKLAIVLYWLSAWTVVAVFVAVCWALYRTWERRQINKQRVRRGRYQL